MADDLPYYIDDPLLDAAAHKLEMIPAPEAGPNRFVGVCSCGGMVTKAWDDYAVLEEYDTHMAQVQQAAHDAWKAQPAGEEGQPGPA